MVYSCGYSKVKAWSISNKQLKYEIQDGGIVNDIVIGRKGTPLENRLVSVGYKGCRISDLETGAEVRKPILNSECWSIVVDRCQCMIAVGTEKNVTFFEAYNFIKVNEIPFEKSVNSLVHDKRYICMLALTCNGEVHSFKV